MASRLADRVGRKLDSVYHGTYKTPEKSNGDPRARGFITGLDERVIGDEMLLAKISALHLRGHGTAEIARECKLKLQQVEDKLRTLKQRWTKIAIEDIDQAVADTLAEVAELKAEYWAAWEKSKGVEIFSRGASFISVGDAAFLDGVMKCIERKCKLLGLDSPIKIDITAQIRQMAIDAGIDPDDAVAEAMMIMSEVKV